MNLGDENERKEKTRDGIKSLLKAGWNKWKARSASNALQAAVKAVVATTVAGGLVIGGVSVSGQLSGNKDSISALKAQNTQVAKDLPSIHSDVDAAQNQAVEAQKKADEAKTSSGSAAALAQSASEQSKKNADHINDVAATIQGDSKENSDAIADVKKDLESGKISSSEAKQQAKEALDQASSNQTALTAEASRVDTVIGQVSKTATDAKSTADGAVVQAKTAQDTANAATTGASDAKKSADDALAIAIAARDTANQAVAAASTAQATADEANQYAHFAADTAIAANSTAVEAISRTPVVLSLSQTLGQYNYADPYGPLPWAFNHFPNYNGETFLFELSWKVIGSCSGGLTVNGSATDPDGRAYPTLSASVTSVSSIHVTVSGTQALYFTVDPSEDCQYSDVILTLTKVT